MLLVIVGFAIYSNPFDGNNKPQQSNAPVAVQDGTNQNFPTHESITATVFWVGEDSDSSNNYIANRSSVWLVDWVGAYGGLDDPQERCENFFPCGFQPNENPYYFALPYNDLDDNGNPKPSQSRVFWYTANTKKGESIVKNRWIEVTYRGKTVYAQWEDAGPFGEDDADYVWGNSTPKQSAGLDLSPAAAAYLGIDGDGKVSWRFVDVNDVPRGPWNNIVTTSGTSL